MYILSILDIAEWINNIIGGAIDFVVYIVKFIIYIFELYGMFLDLIPSPFKEIFSILELIFLIKFVLVIKELRK